MTERRNRPSGASAHRPTAGLIKSERPTDTTVLWRIGTWSGIAITALVAAILVARSPIAARHGALNDAHTVIAAQAKQLQHLIQQNDSETRRLAAALGTLNSDRDRLYQRVTELERNLDTMTGSITRLAARPPAPAASAPPVLSAPQSVPVAFRLAPIPPEPFPPPAGYVFVAQAPKADVKADVTASVAPKPAAAPIPPAEKAAPLPAIPDKPKPVAASKAPLGIDLGSANSVEGLRAIWNSTRKTHAAAVQDLQPIITIQEPKNGLGLQLRLVAGPLPDAASVEKRCAALIEVARPCASASYDGQRLAVRAASVKPAASPSPAPKPPKAAPSEPKTPPKAQRSIFPNLLGP